MSRPLEIARARLPFVTLTAGVLALRVAYPPRGEAVAGPSALRDLGLTLALWLLLCGLGWALGLQLLRRFGPQGLTGLEQLVFAAALGIGGFAYLVLGLGLVGWLSVRSVILLIMALCLWLAPEFGRLPGLVPDLARRLRQGWLQSSLTPRLIAPLAVAIGGLAFLNALGPPWDYDGLMYHLVGPKLFLQSGRLFPYPDNWHLNGPFALEMVFTAGVAFGDDVLPKLVHWSFGVLLALATVAAGRRWLSAQQAWVALAVLLSVPTFPVWAGFAYVDLGWATFEFLAVFCTVQWWLRQDRRWLSLAGVFIGLGLGSKYLALIGLAALAVCIWVAASVRRRRLSLSEVSAFGLPALLVALPWYLKNLIWFGNPVFPFVFGGPDWDQSRLDLYMAYLRSFGVGRSALDYLLLPWNLYAENHRFSAAMTRIDFPSLLFPLAILQPWRGSGRSVTAALGVSALWFAGWSLGSQQLRFLLPIYPALALGVADVIAGPPRPAKGRIPWHLFLPSLAAGLMLITAFYQVQLLRRFGPLGVAAGAESRASYLARVILDYPVLVEAVRVSSEAERVLLLGDGRGYYCLPTCIPDPEHYRFAAVIADLPADALPGWFAQSGIRYVFLGWEYLDFLLQHDSQNTLGQALVGLSRLSELGCLRLVESSPWAVLYEIECRN